MKGKEEKKKMNNLHQKEGSFSTLNNLVKQQEKYESSMRKRLSMRLCIRVSPKMYDQLTLLCDGVPYSTYLRDLIITKIEEAKTNGNKR